MTYENLGCYTYTSSFYSFNSRTGGVKPCSRDPPKSLHDWKQKFFYILRGVIPINMNYRPESEGIPRVNVSIDFTKQEALVAAGMSMLWAPQNPSGFPVYGYRGKAGYSLMNVFDPKAGGAMVVAALPEGRPLWLDQPILLSSEESDDASFHLIRRSSRVGPQRGPSEEPVVEVVPTPVVDPHVGAAEQSEMRMKKGEEKVEEKTAEDPVDETPHKHSSKSPFLDYVVVSDTLSGLDAGVKHSERCCCIIPEKSQLMKESTAAPSESEINFGVFSEKTGNRLEKIFKSSSAPRGSSKSGHSVRKIDISKITPLLLLHLNPLIYLLPALNRREKGRMMMLKLTGRRSWCGGASGPHQSPEFHRVQGGLWTTHNHPCDDLPHAPHWALTQGSIMNDLTNCREFYSFPLPPLRDFSRKTTIAWIF
ncbi:hypothetical protein Hanom_Chr09g00796591 [Helianthus anomalus]